MKTQKIRLKSCPWFNIKMTSHQYRKSHFGDKTILRPSYLHYGIPYIGKTTSLHWIRALEFTLQLNSLHIDWQSKPEPLNLRGRGTVTCSERSHGHSGSRQLIASMKTPTLYPHSRRYDWCICFCISFLPRATFQCTPCALKCVSRSGWHLILVHTLIGVLVIGSSRFLCQLS